MIYDISDFESNYQNLELKCAVVVADGQLDVRGIRGAVVKVAEVGGRDEGTLDIPELHDGTDGVEHLELDVALVEVCVACTA